MSALNPERLFISTDVETMGRIPGLNPLLSIGAAAIDLNEKTIDTFEANLEINPKYTVDLDTASWWADPAKRCAWKKTREAAMPSAMAFAGFIAWLAKLKASYSLEFLAKPASFDIGWLQHHCADSTGVMLIEKWRSWDLHSLMAALSGKPVTEVSMKDMPAFLLLNINTGTEHVGIDDAIYQGRFGVRLIKAVENACKWAQIKELETV